MYVAAYLVNPIPAFLARVLTRAQSSFLPPCMLHRYVANRGERVPSFWTFTLCPSQSGGTMGNKRHEKGTFSGKNGHSDGGGNEVGFGPLDWSMDGACCDFSPNCTTASELRLWEDTRLFPAWCPLSCLCSLKSHGRVQFQKGRYSAVLVSVTAFWQPLASQDQLGYGILCFP